MDKKIKKPIKSKKLNRKKKLIKPIKILKKPTSLVLFYKFEIEKIKPNRTQTEKTKNKPSQVEKIELNRKKMSQNRPKPV